MSMNPYNAFSEKWGLEPQPPSNAPIFLFASIWRSGSTLLQRLLCSNPDLILWGEPYTDTAILPRMAEASKAILQESWLTPEHFISDNEVMKNLSEYWIANLYPPPQAYQNACRVMVDTLFRYPAEENGFSRFGFKEVRHSVDVAQFLQWVYPDARFVFLVRNPWDCWASYRGASWYLQYPNILIESIEDFARLWVKNLSSFLKWHDDSGMLIRYEDLISPNFSLQQLEAHCQLPNISPDPLQKKVRGVNYKPSDPNSEEAFILADICGELAKSFGYFGQRDTRDF